jgi:hypothetical protein
MFFEQLAEKPILIKQLKSSARRVAIATIETALLQHRGNNYTKEKNKIYKTK